MAAPVAESKSPGDDLLNLVELEDWRHALVPRFRRA